MAAEGSGRGNGLLRRWRALPHPVRWLGVALLGGALILAGCVLLVLPGPGMLLLALGLAVLATEFAWAAAVLHRVRKAGEDASRRAAILASRRR